MRRCSIGFSARGSPSSRWRSWRHFSKRGHFLTAGKDEVLALEVAKLTGKSWLRGGKTEQAIKAWDAVLAAHPGGEDLLEDC